MKSSKLILRSLDDQDIDRMTSWLCKEHIAKWYHDPSDWLMEIKQRQGAYSWLHHFIVMDGEIPIGFCQYYDCHDANHLEEWYHVPKPGDTFSIDYLIGDEAYLGRGYGKAIVRLLTDTIGERERARQIIVQPEAENHASNHVLLANGYVFDGEKGYYSKRLD